METNTTSRETLTLLSGLTLELVCDFLTVLDILCLAKCSLLLSKTIKSSKYVWMNKYLYTFADDRRNSNPLSFPYSLSTDEIRQRVLRSNLSHPLKSSQTITTNQKLLNDEIEDSSDAEISTTLVLHRGVFSEEYNTAFFFGGSAELSVITSEKMCSDIKYLSEVCSPTRLYTNAPLVHLRKGCCKVISKGDGSDTQAQPLPRNASVFCGTQFSALFVVFGGYGAENDFLNDLWLAEIKPIVESNAAKSDFEVAWENKTEEKLRRNRQKWPRTRQGHTLTFVKNWNLLVLFGGGNPGNTYNDTWTISVQQPRTDIWNEESDENLSKKVSLKLKSLKTSGDIPTPRAGHSATATSDSLIIFGGNTAVHTCKPDIYILSKQENTFLWRKISPANRVAARIGHSSFVSNGRLIIYGGRDKFHNRFTSFKTLHDFCCAEFGQDEAKAVWKPIELDKSIEPMNRVTGAACFVTSSGRFCASGGFDTVEKKALPWHVLRVFDFSYS